MILNALSATVVAFPLVVLAWLIANTSRAKSGRPAPHVPADVDLAQCVATTRAIAYDVDDWLTYDRLPAFRAAPSDPPAVRAFLEGTP